MVSVREKQLKAVIKTLVNDLPSGAAIFKLKQLNIEAVFSFLQSCREPDEILRATVTAGASVETPTTSQQPRNSYDGGLHCPVGPLSSLSPTSSVNGVAIAAKNCVNNKDMVKLPNGTGSPPKTLNADQLAPPPGSTRAGTFHFRRRREKSTVILVAIVVLFIACHSYRLALKVYEFAKPDANTMDSFNYCYNQGR